MISIRSSLLMLLTALPLTVQAHKAWLLPSSTTVTAGEWISVDAAVSNDVFHFNHAPLRLDNVRVQAPNGESIALQNAITGKFRSAFDFATEAPGTYRISVLNRGLFASWKENGEQRRWRGDAQRFAQEVPAQAEALSVTESLGRVETFVSAGAPTPIAVAGEGLELSGSTHPNDLFNGESAAFKLLLDGQPAAGLKVTVIPGGSRYRNQLQAMEVATAADGSFSVTWPKAGMYWLECSAISEKNVTAPATQKRYTYVATLEVLPE